MCIRDRITTNATCDCLSQDTQRERDRSARAREAREARAVAEEMARRARAALEEAAVLETQASSTGLDPLNRDDRRPLKTPGSDPSSPIPQSSPPRGDGKRGREYCTSAGLNESSWFSVNVTVDWNSCGERGGKVTHGRICGVGSAGAGNHWPQLTCDGIRCHFGDWVDQGGQLLSDENPSGCHPKSCSYSVPTDVQEAVVKGSMPRVVWSWSGTRAGVMAHGQLCQHSRVGHICDPVQCDAGSFFDKDGIEIKLATASFCTPLRKTREVPAGSFDPIRESTARQFLQAIGAEK
eukprot:TRINITY_DN27527_c0_g1_i1.p1 TRINITY_DN27527_c0_g1~~TRINITY_DN27527_c0_g1_i1.p1  ORF type:complete len:294 (-),score=61.18 TRINITY_DN27527_c0_g1_i1:208-1089(-)